MGRARIPRWNGPLAVPPISRGADGDDLGHVVLGSTQAALDISREHERVHVRQYERWGPFFVPAYLLCSLRCYLAGKDYYRDNPFEREAYRKTS